MRRRAFLAAGAAAAIAPPPAVAAAVPPHPVTTAALRNTAGFLSVVASLDGAAVSLLLDTGADAGLLAPAVARRLQLPPARAATWAHLHGTGGRGADAPVVAIGGLALGDGLLLRNVAVPLGDLPAMPRIDPPVAGLLGGDLLRRFDVEIDVAGGTLRLFAPVSGPAAAPLVGACATLPVRFLGNRAVVAAALDGHPVSALLDTGARSRVVSERTARAVGVPSGLLAGEAGGITAGVDGHDAIYHWHRFGSFTLAGERVSGPVLTVAPLDEPVDILLGSDWFANHVVWISYSTSRVFIRPA